MPMLSRTEAGMVIAIWGQAWVRGTDGLFRALKLGDGLQKGAVVLTEQNAIVQIAAPTGDGDADHATIAVTTKTPELGAERAIEGINLGRSDSAPAAGLAGGDGGDLTPGLRVERIAEVVTADALSRNALESADRTLPELPGGHQPQQVTTTSV